ncbi:MAG: glycosyl transferase, group 1 [Frankiales bacterium]|nr:glycosyl transferase, group 1 [Frankiales bacterium]
MRRPGVLHVARDWVRPSEGFVADVVATSSRTRPSVAFGHRGTVSVPAVPSYDLGWASARGDRVLRTGLAGVALRQQARVLHGHFGYWAAHVEAVARRTRRPWGVSLHGHDLLVEGCPAATLADLVVVPSGFLADAASRAGIPDEVLQVIPSGLDLSQFPFRVRRAVAGRPALVTFAGRYVEKKGVLDVARALAGLEGLAVQFVGFGPLEADLRRLLAELRFDAVMLDGSVPGQVRRALQDTDLLITASRVAADGDAESLGLVNLEALACGVPVVTTASGGIPEAVPPAAGILVPEGDVAALRAGVVDLVGHPERWAAMGAAGRAHVEAHFELGSQVAQLEQAWLALADRGGG